MSFVAWYHTQFAETLSQNLDESDGIPAWELASLLCVKSVPQSLLAYYRIAGRHWMNSHFERLLSPDQLRIEGDYLVFMDENQNVGQWGFKCKKPARTIHWFIVEYGRMKRWFGILKKRRSAGF